MPNPRLILVFVLSLATSCLSRTDYKCREIEGNEAFFQDSIASGLEADDGMYAASIRLRGFVENDIRFNLMDISAGAVDTLINHQDQYGTQFFYDIENESGGDVDLEICVSFSHSR